MIGFSINMVTAEEKGKVKVLTSAKAKKDGSVDPAQQVTFEQIHKGEPHILKSQIEVGESSNTRVTSLFSLTCSSVSKKKSVIRNKSTRRRSEDMRKKYTGKNEKNMCENKSACIGDVLFSDTAGTKG
jgi:hypothetical protein